MPDFDLDNLGTLSVHARSASRYRLVLVFEPTTVTAESLARNPGWAGNGLVFAAEVPDSGGKGEVPLAAKRAEIEDKLQGAGPDPKVTPYVVGFPINGSNAGPKVAVGPTMPVRNLK